jgi:PAS domain S-box-containing protein
VSDPPVELGPILPALLEALTHAGMPLVVFADHGGELERVYANEPAAALLGYTVEGLYATPVLDTLVPEHRPLVGQLVAAFKSGQPMPPVMEITLQHRDGSAVPIETSSVRVPSPSGDLYVNLLRAANPPLQAQLTLLEADRIALVGALSAGFAHQINNPLTSVLLNLRTLRKHVSASTGAPPAALQCVDYIALAAERIANNVRALQTLAARSAPEAIDLAALVASALRLAAPTLESVAYVERRLEDGRVIGEESRIGQAVLAMLLFSSSGFDAPVGVPKNHIDVVVCQRGGAVVVEVSDNGRDLTSDEAGRAFDPFFRSSARGAGVGVGLGVARAVATALGGTVSLSPRPGGGAVITMTLPIAPAAAAAVR